MYTDDLLQGALVQKLQETLAQISIYKPSLTENRDALMMLVPQAL